VKVQSKIFYVYVAFVLIVAAIAFIPAPNHDTLVKYHLTSLGLKLLQVTLLIPEAIIWFAAFYGYDRLHRYSQLIKDGAEGKHIRLLSLGLLFLALGLPTTAIVSDILSRVAEHHHSFTATSVVIKNYLGLLFPLAAFFCISLAARGLSTLTRTRPSFLTTHIVILIAITLGVVFCCLIVANHRELRLTYHLSTRLVMLTLGIPYMYIWFLGLQACAELQEYSRNLTGILYRKGWNLLIGGLVATIFVSIVLQYLTATSSWILSLNLGSLLLLLYALLILLGGTYIVVALGANKLTRIEEA
jgi:hypothetical protein